MRRTSGGATNPPTAGGFRRVVRGGGADSHHVMSCWFLFSSSDRTRSRGRSLLRDGQHGRGPLCLARQDHPNPPFCCPFRAVFAWRPVFLFHPVSSFLPEWRMCGAALSRFRGSVGGVASFAGALLLLCRRWGTPEMDLFGSRRLPQKLQAF
ncbi:hypothetical protein GWK47_019329 [Chionoecetes opilio]|uniref:Uncharacterized protein n=1 Tax=Chionoecetes opilio TaxID=41210 RepID=A0A8J5BXC5_CHIOP|nr:hypothetical protein GWK47_019329 [Chionoecetes opilio]